ncbi:CAM1, partial [Symbiodinium pilosum]
VKTAIMKSLEKQHSQITFEEAVEATFRTFDAEGTGHLTAKQLQASMRSIGLTLSDTAVEDMIKEADQQQQGFVDYPDFVTICRICGMGPVKAAK